jgi:hypothetical protein
LREQIYQQALAEANKQMDAKQSLWPKLISSNIKEEYYSAKENDETSEFKVEMKLETVVVAFDETQLIAEIKEKLNKSLLTDKKLIDFDPKSLVYSIEDYDLTSGQATIKVSLEASSIMTSIPDFIDKSKLVNLTEEEVKSYFSLFPAIKDVRVEFHPEWVKKMPKFKDKIRIEIAQP